MAPLGPQDSWAAVKSFARGIVQHMAAAEPALYTANPSKAQRQGKIFLDYLRNDRGATSVAPSSTARASGRPFRCP